eukprot:s686_g13.t1
MFFSESSPVLLQRSSRKYTTEEAVDLHDTVPPDHWCVTRSDLQYLQREVQRAIDVGEIQPPEDGTDDFKACGEQYGPSIYTVNIQHIMPVTEMAGKVSWALMRHPEGLECELFISHAWQEGIFEFLSKVLHSWPTDVRHAWCCMLANPQNLDIGAMLLSPSTSPFALALEASTYVLVVPNRHCSIYTRLWCGYEAYRAHEQGKVIFIARASNLRKIFPAVMGTMLSGSIGMLSGVCALQHRAHDWHALLLLVGTFAAFASASLESNRCRIILNNLGTAVSCALLIQWQEIQEVFAFGGYAARVPYIEQHFVILVGASFFILLEVDRVNGRTRTQEALQLSRGFRGSIAHAKCSKASDGHRIFMEIGEKTSAVDYAIHVLLAAGMSTPTLREVARAGVDIQNAGYAEVAVPVWAFMTSLVTCGHVLFDSVYMEMHSPSPAWFVMPALVYTSILAIACLGMRRVLAFPGYGRCLLQLFLARGRSILPSALSFCALRSDSDSESESAVTFLSTDYSSE